mmetsp:Transcript_43770/g.126484  ORF Transcript_43770/g.126484 Transcript_43770/m.126484 type:complete len:169 (-) Transcript_43770:1754-2260(-)
MLVLVGLNPFVVVGAAVATAGVKGVNITSSCVRYFTCFGKHWEYHMPISLHRKPSAQQVGPFQLLPPHLPKAWTQPPVWPSGATGLAVLAGLVAAAGVVCGCAVGCTGDCVVAGNADVAGACVGAAGLVCGGGAAVGPGVVILGGSVREGFGATAGPFSHHQFTPASP